MLLLFSPWLRNNKNNWYFLRLNQWNMFTIEVQNWRDVLPLIMISYISRQGTKEEHHNPNVHKYQVLRMENKIPWLSLSIKRHDFCVTNIKYIMHNVQYYSVHQNNAVRQVICEGWHFTHMLKALAWLHHFTKMGGFCP